MSLKKSTQITTKMIESVVLIYVGLSITATLNNVFHRVRHCNESCIYIPSAERVYWILTSYYSAFYNNAFAATHGSVKSTPARDGGSCCYPVQLISGYVSRLLFVLLWRSADWHSQWVLIKYDTVSFAMDLATILSALSLLFPLSAVLQVGVLTLMDHKLLPLQTRRRNCCVAPLTMAII